MIGMADYIPHKIHMWIFHNIMACGNVIFKISLRLNEVM